MNCPKCKKTSEVIETHGPFRDRRCLNRKCRKSFTTLETVLHPPVERAVTLYRHSLKPPEKKR